MTETALKTLEPMDSLSGAQGLIWPKSVVIKDALHDRHIDLFNKSMTIFHGLYSN